MMRKLFYMKVFLFFFIIGIITDTLYSQSYLIKGNISTFKVPVKNAEVIFINISDTLKKYSALTDASGNYQVNLITSIKDKEETIPATFELSQNYPNPFSNETVITYKLNEPSNVNIKIYNVLGQEIKTFQIGERFYGIHKINWDGKDNYGKKVAAGIYFYLMQAGKVTNVKKMILGSGSGLSNLKLTTQQSEESFNPVKTKEISGKLDADSNNYRVKIINNSSTQPQIFSKVQEAILIQRDTTIDYIVDITGPWRKVKSGISDWLYDIDFPDSRNGWVVGSRGLILNSIDGGETWTQQLCPFTEPLNAVDFIDKETGWICSNYSILKTTDGGKNWVVKFSEDMVEGRFHDIQFLNNKIGFVTGGKSFYGSNGVLFKTTDGGETWKNIIPEALPTLTHISIVNENNIWICGFGTFGGTILYSSDSGVIWTKKNLAARASWLRTIQFVDKKNGWVGCDDDDWPSFYRTTDGGDTWRPITDTVNGWPLAKGAQSIFFVDSLKGWVGTVPGAQTYAILHTKDGGQTWEYLPGGPNIYDVKSFSFINEELGWAVGSNVDNSKNKCVIMIYKKQ